jgi:hypothetical protein
MGFWSSFSSISSALSNLNTDKVEDDITYQKYHHDIKNFNIESTLQNSVNVNRGQSNPTIFAKNHDEIDDIETLEDVKKFFEQRENKE